MARSGQQRIETDELFMEERRQRILADLRKHGKVQVHALSGQLGVSEVTIRNDLNALSAEGMLQRTHGGAIAVTQSRFTTPLRERHAEAPEQKRRIAARAIAMIERGDTIILDAGTTTYQIAIGLVDQHELTVITADLDIAQLLAGAEGVELIVTGGTPRRSGAPLVGPVAMQTLRSLRVDKAFISATAIDTRLGLMTTDLDEAAMRARLFECARQRIIVADSRKFANTALALVAPVGQLHVIITDDGIGAEDRAELEARGARVVIA